MTLDEFRQSLSAEAPQTRVPLLEALWHAGRGDWDKAHRIAQDIDTPEAAWVHAYLHRQEGDLSNARYWYRRAGQPAATDSLETEWTRIATALLE